MKRFRFLFIIFGLVLLASLGVTWRGYAQESEPQPTPEPVPAEVNAPAPSYRMYMPHVANSRQYTVSGKIVDENGSPVKGVTVMSDIGATGVSDSAGNYSVSGIWTGPAALSPSGGGRAFSPGVQEIYVTKNTSGINFTAYSVTELLVNGGFENNKGWVLPVTEYTAGYSSSQRHTGSRSMRTGIEGGNNVYSYSDAKQTVTIPSGATSVRLYLWLFPQSSETSTALDLTPPQIGEKLAFSEATENSDAQYVLVLDSGGNILETLVWMRSNNRMWTEHQFNLTKWAGYNVQIVVGTYNDGIGGLTAMYVDDASLQVVKDSAPPVATCANALSNSSFESNTAWNIPATPYSAGYSSARAYTGSRSMRTGIVNSADNRYAYSDAWQTASIPSNAISAKMKLRYFPLSGEVATGLLEAAPPPMPAVTNIEELHAAAAEEDAQYMLILDNNGNILQTLFWIKSNAGSWKYTEIDMLKYKGQTIRVQFGTVNDGKNGVTAMYVDDLYIDWCTGSSPDPTVCTNMIANGGFENNGSWIIPPTAYTAGYSSFIYRTGARSMRTGIYYQSHERYSYSDARQAVKLPQVISKALLTVHINPRTNDRANDVQYLLILDQYGNWIDTLFWMLENKDWTRLEYDLRKYAGETIQINFGTYNDGLNGVSSLYVDDVKFEVCP
jgi:hypothetical protein